MQLKGVVRFRRRHISLVELDGRSVESTSGVAALALLAASRRDGGWDHIGFIVRLEVGINVRFPLLIRDVNCVRRSLGRLERVRHGQCDELAVIANNVVFEGWPALVGNPFESRALNRAKNSPDILAMKYRPHTRHFLGGGG